MRKSASEFEWTQRRAREAEFVDQDPAVVILGAGHSGLVLAARLQQFQVPTLIIEKNPRIGNGVRTFMSNRKLFE